MGQKEEYGPPAVAQPDNYVIAQMKLAGHRYYTHC